MKRWLTIGYLPLRSTIFPLTGLLILLGLAEGTVFWLLRNQLFPLTDFLDLPVLLLYTAAMIFTGFLFVFRCSGGTATLGRLDLSPMGQFLLWGGWNTLCFFLLAAWQVILFLLIGTAYFLMVPEDAHAQAMMLAVYRSDLMYLLLPLWEPLRYLCNLATWASLGFSTALWTFLRGKRRWHVLPFLSLGLTLYSFTARPGSAAPYVCGLIHLGLVAWCVVIWGEVSHEKA